MINHVRTLLVNKTHSSGSLRDPFEVYIPPSYAIRRDDSLLRFYRSTIFGTQPDRLFVNLRAKQLMQFLHASPLVDFVTTDDSRLTYFPWAAESIDAPRQLVVTAANGDGQSVLTVIGKAAVEPVLGRASYRYVLTNEASHSTHTITLIDQRNKDTTVRSIATGDAAAQVPQITPLGSTGLMYTVTPEATTRKMTWHIDVEAYDMPDLSDKLYRLYQYCETNINVLFPLTEAEPVSTWRRIFKDHDFAISKYAAMLLGLARHTSRQGTAGS